MEFIGGNVKLNEFQLNITSWAGDEKDSSLYNYWKSLKSVVLGNSIAAEEVESESIVVADMNQTNDSMCSATKVLDLSDRSVLNNLMYGGKSHKKY